MFRLLNFSNTRVVNINRSMSVKAPASLNRTVSTNLARICITDVKRMLLFLTSPVATEERKSKIPKTLELNSRPQSASAARATIPLSSSKDSSFKELYINHQGNVRIGRLLEDLDMFAGWIAYRHNSDQEYSGGKSPLSIVTAGVDSVSIYKPEIKADQDLFMFGIVSWTGNSSMEITMHLTQDRTWHPDQANTLDPNGILDGKFVMVARDHKADGSAARVYPLKVSTDTEKELFNLGELNKKLRIERSKIDLFKKPPSDEESSKIHELYLKKLDGRFGSFNKMKESTDDNPYILMGDTKLKSCILCQPEHKNVHNKIFGGYLMRSALELGEANFSLAFNEICPRCIDVADIDFRAPVEIGSLLLLNSQIIYSQNKMSVVRIHAQVVKPTVDKSIKVEENVTKSDNINDSNLETKLTREVSLTGHGSILDSVRQTTNVTEKHKVTTTNVFYFVFESSGVKSLPLVLPTTYGESLMYIDGDRRMVSMLKRYGNRTKE